MTGIQDGRNAADKYGIGHEFLEPRGTVEEFGEILTAIERGGLVHLRRIADAVRADPFGSVSDEDLAEAVELTDDPRAARLRVLLDDSREGATATVRRRINDAIAVSGLSLREFADRVGAGASRLSTYATGKVQPSAAMFVRITESGTATG